MTGGGGGDESNQVSRSKRIRWEWRRSGLGMVVKVEG